MNKNLKIAYSALMISGVFVLTRWIQIPIPNAAGYIHLGDAVIFLTAFLLGPVPAMIAGAAGSALADWTSPYAQYAPFTFVIKGLMGYVAGWIYEHSKKDLAAMILASFSGGILMAGGYFIVERFMYSNWITPLAGLPINCIQAIAGSAAGIAVFMRIKNRINNKYFCTNGPAVYCKKSSDPCSTKNNPAAGK
jgi:uncharacterized membrane protein